MISWFGAAFCVAKPAPGAPLVAAKAPPVSDNKPAAPSTGTAFAPRLRFGACFAFDNVKSSGSVGSIVSTQPALVAYVRIDC